MSYGEASNRQVERGKARDEGEPNRRVTLVVDFAGQSSGETPMSSGAAAG